MYNIELILPDIMTISLFRVSDCDKYYKGVHNGHFWPLLLLFNPCYTELFLYKQWKSKIFFNLKLSLKSAFSASFALIAMEIFHYMHDWKSPTRMVSHRDAMLSCIFHWCDVRMRIDITPMVPRGYLRGPPLKRIRFLGVVLSGGSQ